VREPAENRRPIEKKCRWNYRFIDSGLAVLGPVRRTSVSETIRGIAQRGGGLRNQEAKLMFDFGISQGRGGLYLDLTDEQYSALNK
jgi:hypothetical protein